MIMNIRQKAQIETMKKQGCTIRKISTELNVPKAGNLTDFKLHFPVVAKLFHLANRGRRSSEAFSAVDQYNAFGLADEV